MSEPMNDTIVKRLSNLLSVKSLVTLTLTAVFAWMACSNSISKDFMTIYAVIIAFYFGTQSQKVQECIDGEAARPGSKNSPRDGEAPAGKGE